MDPIPPDFLQLLLSCNNNNKDLHFKLTLLNTTIKEFKDKNTKKAIQLCSEVLLGLQQIQGPSSFFLKDLISVSGVEFNDARILLEASLHLYIAKLYSCSSSNPSSKESHLLQCQQLLLLLLLRKSNTTTTTITTTTTTTTSEESLLKQQQLRKELRKECIMELAQVYKLKGNEHLYNLTMRQLLQ
ncbi:hypothetical protein MP638_005388 [Amoeboaphelidium occidentale]|nr:hypothetical protein MP638_005388 [Amoeboaphelidium occidentale]